MSNPRAIIADVAAKHIGLRETTPNRFAGIDTFWAATNYPEGGKNREPWCSAFASYCVQEADRQSAEIRLRVPPRFAAVRDWLPWAKRAGCVVFSSTSTAYTPERGDIVVFLPRISGISHIGIVAGFAGGTVHTIEGNTNAAGSREGDGCYDKVRRLSFCGAFIRIPTV